MTRPAFPDTAGEAAWRAAVDKVLKGDDFERRLVTRSYDGIPLEPLYPAADTPAPSGARRPCAVVARLDHPDAEEAEALEELENGADGLVLVVAGAATARGFGLDLAGLAVALRGVELGLLPLRLDPAPFAGLDAMRALLDLAEARRLDPAALDLDAGLDPLGDIARAAEAPEPWPALARLVADGATGLRDRGFAGPVLRADGRPHHEAGASEAQELAAGLAAGVAYLRALDAAGVPPDEGRRALSFLLAADADEMLTIAKFRALRRLWAWVEESCGLVPAPIRLHAETSWRMMARLDPHTNLLRATLACVGAVLGGADGVTVLPFTAPLGLADPSARRLARNTALVLLREAGLDRVADPAAGSGAIEAVTEALCSEAWVLFREIEREGGLAAALAGGSWQARVAGMRERRATALRLGVRAVVGTTAFRLAAEVPVTVLRPMPAVAPRLAPGAMPSMRDDQLFEADDAAPRIAP